MSRLNYLSCVVALAAASMSLGYATDPGELMGDEPFAELEREPYRYQLPDGGRIAVGTGIRNGDTLLIENDIVIPASQDKEIANAAVAFNLWPSNIIAYEFDPAIDATTRQRVLDAMKPWQDAGIYFIQRTSQSRFVRITTAYLPQYQWVCAATLGYQNVNTYYAGTGCRMRDYVHEWGHIPGLYHEHLRNDRDQYIIADPSLGETIGSRGYDSGAYDFGSIMHYDAYARNSDGSIDYSQVLIRPRDGRSLSSFGWNSIPSYQDIDTVYWLYWIWNEPPCGGTTGTICR